MTSSDESIHPTNLRGISDYLLESTADEIRQLKLEIIQLKSDLDMANARAAFYEQQSEAIHEIVKSSLRTAFEIKQNAEKQAEEITRQAQQERKRLQEEITTLAAERDRVREELEAAQKSLGSTQKQRSELDLKKEQLRSDLDALDQRLRAIRTAFDSTPTASPMVAATKKIDTPDPEPKEVISEKQPTTGLSPVESSPGDSSNPVIFANDASPSAVADVPAEDRGSDKPNAADNGRSSRRRLNLADFLSTKPGNDIELVVSSLHGFPKLVEFERALHEFVEIKNFYVRDFRNGVARLVVRLKDPSHRQELQTRLATLPGWNMSITSSEPSKIEIKVTS